MYVEWIDTDEVRMFSHMGTLIEGMTDHPRFLRAIIKWFHFYTGQIAFNLHD